MKTLKESILSRSSHRAEGFKEQRREMIKEWLKKYNIKNYTINNDFTIDVDDDVNICAINLKEFPEYIQFGIVTKSFYCSENKLTSLRGCPREVGGLFDCSDNKLTSLEEAPESVGSYFDCHKNNLTSLRGVPEKVKGYFDCSRNQLISIEGAPKEVGGSFYCYNNQLTSLEGAPKKVGLYFDCRNNKARFTKDDVRRVCEIGDKIVV